MVPEVVTWEANGKDAQSVDYTRLTALLIEATKQQQSEIAALNTKLRSALEQISSQRTLIRKQTATVNVLEKEIHPSTLGSAAAIPHAVSTAQEHRTAHAVATAPTFGPAQR